MKQFKLIVLIIVMSCLSIIQAQEADADDVEPNKQPQSLFTGDTCYAPCWFGLVSGESTSRDLENMLQENSELFYVFPSGETDVYSADGQLLDGYVQLLWTNQVLVLDYVSTMILIEVNDSIISFIGSPPQNEQKNSDILATYGEPDFASLYFGQVYILRLIYVDESISVSLTILKDTEIDTFGGAFTVYRVQYFSPSDLEEIFESYLLDPLDKSTTRLVPLETLQCWAEEKDTCISSWWDLPEDKDIDLSPWVEDTTEPTP